MKKRNALVAQSGGPSPVINASLQGVMDACRQHPDTGTLYGAWHGIEGVLKEELINLTRQDAKEVALLKTTPAAGQIGTCRYKLTDALQQDYARILDVFRAHDIGYFFYIGGNDSMDTACKTSMLAHAQGYDLIVTGIPKTIDNDVGDNAFTIIDHTPGYASCARYWAHLIQNINEENRAISVSEPVCVLQAMGRKSGWITAAARLGDPLRAMPLQLYMAEAGFTLPELYARVNEELARSGRCIVVVSEGFDVGGIGEKHDGFGHIEYGASGTTAAQAVVNYLNTRGLAVKGNATGQIPGVIQRGVSMQASAVDIDEAYHVGRHAVMTALCCGTGYMATILRKKQPGYAVYYDKTPLETAANSVRYIQDSWLSKDKPDVTDDFIRYAAPLIGEKNSPVPLENGLQRFARLSISLIEKKLPAYTPERERIYPKV
ncbi:MAG: diphosphate--fructose-6-phosphate 1-phosphotransferase [Clostridiales bacterium]|jgi:6-phosphofructokinase 1|nr:diphosphate--fructose-6-phosphate 1-phosphotransferase [Clostridiales bacterium]